VKGRQSRSKGERWGGVQDWAWNNFDKPNAIWKEKDKMVTEEGGDFLGKKVKRKGCRSIDGRKIREAQNKRPGRDEETSKRGGEKEGKEEERYITTK